MKNEQCLSLVTQEYLSAFDCILKQMICGMTEAELSNSISYNFIIQMIPHHRAAIEMSENILRFTTNLQIQNIALNIIEEQTKSIDNMLKVECPCGNMSNCEADLCQHQKQMDNIMQIMFSEMKHARYNNDVNLNFMWEMIPHHMGAVRMSETTLGYPICPQLVPILKAIISSQKRGIAQMQQLLRCMM